MSLSAAERARYSRHLLLPEIGEAGQHQLKAARVLLIGAGGLGSPAAMYLAAAGVGTIGIIDGDRVDLSNLQRQLLFDTAQVGAPKATTAKARLLALNPEIKVLAYDHDFTAGNSAELLAQFDVIIDGSDRLGTRYLVNDACVIHGKPLISAAIHRFEGQAMTYVPGKGPCYRCLFPDTAEDLVPNCAAAGVLGVLPGVMGALQATEAIKLIAGIGETLVGRLLTYDALELRFSEFHFERRRDCRVCGERPTITALSVAAAGCASNADAGQPRQYSPAELLALISEDTALNRLQLVDVREPAEFAGGHLEGSINIPLAELATRLPGLRSAQRQIVYICQSGVRSLRACQIAAGQGLPGGANLSGGVQAWLAAGLPHWKSAG